MITKEFERLILNSVLKNDQSELSEYYIGLCNNVDVTRETTLADLTEVTGDGYSRIKVERAASDWLANTEQPDCLSVRSAEKVFTANGDWTQFNRLFLTTVASGTTGSLLAITTPLPVPVVLSATNKYPVAFELFLK